MAEKSRFSITAYKRLIRSPRSLVMIAIGISAFAVGVFFALPAYRKDFSRVEFSRVSIMAEVADTSEAREKGLSGRLSLPERAGMLFVTEKPEYISIWMKEMKFPIDILWISNGTVVDMKENVLPPRESEDVRTLPKYTSLSPADFVLEVAAGFSRAHEIHIGDRVSIELHGRTYAHVEKDEDGAMRLVSRVSSPTPVGNEYLIDTLRKETLRGSDFTVKEQLETNQNYDKYAISYRSGDLIISGVMNVPKETPPSDGFPILILNHGLIPSSLYTTGRGSKREQDFFARHGYVTIHPDYRGHASSSPSPLIHHDFYVGYTQDVTALLDAIERASFVFMDTTRIGMWGHSMGGGIAARVMVLRPEVKAFVLFAPISADVEDNFYELTTEEVGWLRATYGPAGDEIYRKMSPIEYFDSISAPVQVHHGTADIDVPISFSQKIYDALKQYTKQVEFFIYPNQKHEFIEDWPLAAARALQFFDHYVKE